MTELIWSPQALRDLEGIRAYIALDSPLYANLTVRRVVAALERLKAFPESGRIVPERNAPDIREVIVGRYRVVYRRKAAAVEIATVFLGSRQFSLWKTQGRPNNALEPSRPLVLYDHVAAARGSARSVDMAVTCQVSKAFPSSPS